MDVPTQVARLATLGVARLARIAPSELAALGARLPRMPDAVVVVHPSLVRASALAPLLRRKDKEGFVVEDMADLDAFVPAPGVEVPDAPLYLIDGVRRGDEMRSWSPAEAYPEIAERGRTPLTIGEGISWLLQQPDRLEPNHCFMCLGSRKPKGAALDARTPALWISGGTGRDGRDRRGAPKVGWCWHRNRHTWLGFASAASRIG